MFSVCPSEVILFVTLNVMFFLLSHFQIFLNVFFYLNFMTTFYVFIWLLHKGPVISHLNDVHSFGILFRQHSFDHFCFAIGFFYYFEWSHLLGIFQLPVVIRSYLLLTDVFILSIYGDGLVS